MNTTLNYSPNFDARKRRINQIKFVIFHYTGMRRENDAIKKISQLFNKYDYLILVGGSGLYIDAICNGVDKIPTINKEIRESINQEFDKKGLEWLQKKIFEIDPEFYSKTYIKNPQRLKRCLEVFKGTGNKLSSYHKKKKKKRDFQVIKIGIKTDREDLYKTINKRVDMMINHGLVKESKSLIKYSSNQNMHVFHFSALNSSISGSLEQKDTDINKRSKIIFDFIILILN